ncbi:MAG: hypothetical protein LBF79_06260 [Dysgonamonadaceae bacterium]|jgi:hypothetical protein|nr:hypothetical protein [Dysgonamonadaceae bacterium]
MSNGTAQQKYNESVYSDGFAFKKRKKNRVAPKSPLTYSLIYVTVNGTAL